MLLAWLGEQRIPSDEDLAELGDLLLEQTRLRKFERLERLFLQGIAPKYKRFRAERVTASRWYEWSCPVLVPVSFEQCLL